MEWGHSCPPRLPIAAQTLPRSGQPQYGVETCSLRLPIAAKPPARVRKLQVPDSKLQVLNSKPTRQVAALEW